MREMNDTEKFLYDLQGYIVIPQVLSPGEVKELNSVLDAHRHEVRPDVSSTSDTLQGELRRQLISGMLTWEHPECDPFRRLIAHPHLRPYLNSILRPGWRMDQEPFAFIAEQGTEGLVFHGPGRTSPGSGFIYEYNNGLMSSGMVTVEWMLTDAGRGEGGFAAIPGSHKANFHCPPEIVRWEAHHEIFENPEVRAGDVLIFNEATLHGTLPWTKPEERRVLLYRYSPGWMQLGGGMVQWDYPDWMSELSEAERTLFEPPALQRPRIEDDGSVVRP